MLCVQAQARPNTLQSRTTITGGFTCGGTEYIYPQERCLKNIQYWAMIAKLSATKTIFTAIMIGADDILVQYILKSECA